MAQIWQLCSFYCIVIIITSLICGRGPRAACVVGVCDADLAHARFNHGLVCGPTSHTESIGYCVTEVLYDLGDHVKASVL